MEATIDGYEKLWDMHIGEFAELGADVEVRRVPGGWLFIEKVEKTSRFFQTGKPTTSRTYVDRLPPVFVPYHAPTPPSGQYAAPTMGRPPGLRKSTDDDDDNDNSPF